MNHLLVCGEFPPAPSGGIGTYAIKLCRLLADSGETVHVISRLWETAQSKVEEHCQGRLIIHRIPFQDWTSLWPRWPHPELTCRIERGLFRSGYSPLCFSWSASLLAERLVEEEGIDIIEAQEYEAPLYYFQLRRALGLGPRRQPPCLIHAHSPTEFIARYSDWNQGRKDLILAKRLESYCIDAADKLLCPSRYLASQLEQHFGLKKGATSVIPYPAGETQFIHRKANVWEDGVICYVGRLELRKGVLEWVDAAVSVARDYPQVRFEFLGADTFHRGASVRAAIQQRIPRSLKNVFRFRGEQSITSLSRYLADARIVVVPSRWENFPNVCIEAMATGMPVIATREGGMVEMIKDGQTGWLTNQAGPEGLAEALRRALATRPSRIAEMGVDAAAEIRQLCDNNRILDSHLSLRREIVAERAVRSRQLPAGARGGNRKSSTASTRQATGANLAEGIALVVNVSAGAASLRECLRSVTSQTTKPASLVIVRRGANYEIGKMIHASGTREAWKRVSPRCSEKMSSSIFGINAVLNSSVNPLAIAVLSSKDRLEPNFVAVCESILRNCPEVGLVSAWAFHSRSRRKDLFKLCPQFPYERFSKDAAPFSVIRTEAIVEAISRRTGCDQVIDQWQLFDSVLAAGWIGVTVPEVLVHHQYELASLRPEKSWGENRAQSGEHGLVREDAEDAYRLVESATVPSLHSRNSVMWEQISTARSLIRHPRTSAIQVLRRFRGKIRCYLRSRSA